MKIKKIAIFLTTLFSLTLLLNPIYSYGMQNSIDTKGYNTSSSTPTSTFTPNVLSSSTNTTSLNCNKSYNNCNISLIDFDNKNIEFDRTLSDELIKIINLERSKLSLYPYMKDDILQKVSDYRVNDMITKNYFDHSKDSNNNKVYQFNDIYNLINYSYIAGGENIALTNKQDISAKSFYDYWCTDDDHKDLIFSPKYTNIGISIGHIKDSSTYLAVIDTSIPSIQNTNTAIDKAPTIESSSTNTHDNTNIYFIFFLFISFLLCKTQPIKKLSR